MGWIYLLIASVAEIGWPLGLKLISLDYNRIFWTVFAIIAMILSSLFLYLAQKTIPMGTAYAIWTGLGASAVFIIGVVFFKDALSVTRVVSIIFIIAGIIGLKLST